MSDGEVVVEVMEDAQWNEIMEYLVNKVIPARVKGRQKGNWRVKMEKLKWE